MPDTATLSPEEFARRVKAKHPQYASVPDTELTQRVLEKYPQYRSQVSAAAMPPANPPAPQQREQATGAAVHPVRSALELGRGLGEGFLPGVADTAAQAGAVMQKFGGDIRRASTAEHSAAALASEALSRGSTRGGYRALLDETLNPGAYQGFRSSLASDAISQGGPIAQWLESTGRGVEAAARAIGSTLEPPPIDEGAFSPRNLGRAISRMMPQYLAAIGGGVAGELVGGPVGGLGAFTVLGIGPSLGQQYMESRDYWLQRGASPRFAEAAASNEAGTAAVITATTNLFPAAAILRRVPGGEQMLTAVAKRVAGRMLSGAVAEGAQEVAEQVLTETMVGLQRQDPVTYDQAFFQRVGLAGLTGAIMGGVAGGTVHGGHELEAAGHGETATPEQTLQAIQAAKPHDEQGRPIVTGEPNPPTLTENTNDSQNQERLLRQERAGQEHGNLPVEGGGPAAVEADRGPQAQQQQEVLSPEPSEQEILRQHEDVLAQAQRRLGGASEEPAAGAPPSITEQFPAPAVLDADQASREPLDAQLQRAAAAYRDGDTAPLREHLLQNNREYAELDERLRETEIEGQGEPDAVNAVADRLERRMEDIEIAEVMRVSPPENLRPRAETAAAEPPTDPALQRAAAAYRGGDRELLRNHLINANPEYARMDQQLRAIDDKGPDASDQEHMHALDLEEKMHAIEAQALSVAGEPATAGLVAGEPARVGEAAAIAAHPPGLEVSLAAQPQPRPESSTEQIASQQNQAVANRPTRAGEQPRAAAAAPQQAAPGVAPKSESALREGQPGSSPAAAPSAAAVNEALPRHKGHYSSDPALRNEFVQRGAGHARFSQELDRAVAGGTLSALSADILRHSIIANKTRDAYLQQLSLESGEVANAAGESRPGVTDVPPLARGDYAERSRAQVQIMLSRGLANSDWARRAQAGETDVHDLAVAFEELAHAAHALVPNEHQKALLDSAIRQVGDPDTAKGRRIWETHFENVFGTREAGEYAASSVEEIVAHLMVARAFNKPAPSSRLGKLIDRLFRVIKGAVQRLRGEAADPKVQKLLEKFESLFTAMERGDIQPDRVKGTLGARRFTTIPRNWIGRELYNWKGTVLMLRKGFRATGAKGRPVRVMPASFDAQLDLVPRDARRLIEAVKEHTHEWWLVEGRGQLAGQYLAPKDLVAQLKANMPDWEQDVVEAQTRRQQRRDSIDARRRDFVESNRARLEELGYSEQSFTLDAAPVKFLQRVVDEGITPDRVLALGPNNFQVKPPGSSPPPTRPRIAPAEQQEEPPFGRGLKMFGRGGQSRSTGDEQPGYHDAAYVDPVLKSRTYLDDRAVSPETSRAIAAANQQGYQRWAQRVQERNARAAEGVHGYTPRANADLVNDAFGQPYPDTQIYLTAQEGFSGYTGSGSDSYSTHVVLSDLPQLESLGRGSEGHAFTDPEHRFAYKFYPPIEGADGPGIGLTGEIFELGAIATPESRHRLFYDIKVGTLEDLLDKVRVLTALGGVPTEIVGMNDQGVLITKQPLGHGRGESLKFDPMPPRLAIARNEDFAGQPYIATVHGKPYAIFDVRDANLQKDRAGRLRMIDIVVAKIDPKLIETRPWLQRAIELAGNAEAEMTRNTGDRYARARRLFGRGGDQPERKRVISETADLAVLAVDAAVKANAHGAQAINQLVEQTVAQHRPGLALEPVSQRRADRRRLQELLKQDPGPARDLELEALQDKIDRVEAVEKRVARIRQTAKGMLEKLLTPQGQYDLAKWRRASADFAANPEAARLAYTGGIAEGAARIKAKLPAIRAEMRKQFAQKRSDMTGLQQQLIRAIEENLPVNARGYFLRAVKNATTPSAFTRAFRMIDRRLAKVQISQFIKEIRRLASKSGLKQLTNERRTLANKHLSSAELLWQDSRKKKVSTSELVNTASMLQELRNKIAEVRHEHEIENTIMVGHQRQEAAAYRDRVVNTLTKRAPLKSARADGPARPADVALARQFLRRRLTPDSVAMAIDKDFSGSGASWELLVGQFWQGETAASGEMRRFMGDVEPIIKAAGFKDLADAREKLSGTLGRASQYFLGEDGSIIGPHSPKGERAKIMRVGGHRLTLGQALDIFAKDPETQLRETKQPYTFADRKHMAPFHLEPLERVRVENAIPEELKTMVQQIKQLHNDQFRDRVFKVHREIKGYEPPPVEDYYPIRLNQGMALEQAETPLWRRVSDRHLEDAGFLKAREGESDTPMQIGDFLGTIMGQARASAAIIHMAQRVRAAEAVLRHPEVKSEIEQRLGESAVSRVEEIIRQGSMAQPVQLHAIARGWLNLVRNVSRGLTVINPRTWGLNLLGGTSMLYSVLPESTVRKGIAALGLDAAAGSQGKRGDVLRRMINGSDFAWSRYMHDMGGRLSQQTVDELTNIDPKALSQAMLLNSRRSWRQLRAAVREVKAGNIGQAYENFASGMGELVRAGNLADSIPLQIAWAGLESDVNEQHPEWSDEQKTRWVSWEFEKAVRRSQNTSSPNDTDGFVALSRESSLATLVAPLTALTGDSQKKANVAFQAIASGDKSKIARTAAALGLSTLSSMAIKGAVGYGLYRLLATLLGRFDEIENQDKLNKAKSRAIWGAVREFGGMVPGGDQLTDMLETYLSGYYKGVRLETPMSSQLGEMAMAANDIVMGAKRAAQGKETAGQAIWRGAQTGAVALSNLAGLSFSPTYWLVRGAWPKGAQPTAELQRLGQDLKQRQDAAVGDAGVREIQRLKQLKSANAVNLEGLHRLADLQRRRDEALTPQQRLQAARASTALRQIQQVQKQAQLGSLTQEDANAYARALTDWVMGRSSQFPRRPRPRVTSTP